MSGAVTEVSTETDESGDEEVVGTEVGCDEEGAGSEVGFDEEGAGKGTCTLLGGRPSKVQVPSGQRQQ